MKSVFTYLTVLSMVFGIMAFECSPAELTDAKSYIQQMQFDNAKESLLTELRKNPTSDEGWYLLGYLYGEANNVVSMTEAFGKSLSISKKFASQISESVKYYWAISFNNGVSNFNKAAIASTKDSANMFYDKAVADFTHAIMLQPDSLASYTNLVYTYLNMNKVDEAIPVLEKAMTVASSPDVTVMLGQIYNEKGAKLMEHYQASKNVEDSVQSSEWYGKAINVLEKGRTTFPENGDILSRLLNAYIGAHKLDVATDAFRAGVEKEPKNKYYRYNYGVLLLNSNDYTGAETQFKKAIEIDPAYTNAIYNLAVTYLRWGTHLKEDMAATGNVTDTYKEKINLAIPMLEKYLTQNPKEPQIWELLGSVYIHLGMQEKSEDAFKKADQYR